MLDPTFLLMSTGSITVAALSTVTSYGAPQYSTSSSTWRAFEENGTRLVVTAAGVQEIATSTIFVLSSSASIGPQDRLTRADGSIPRVLSVDVLRDEHGQHHVEVAVG